MIEKKMIFKLGNGCKKTFRIFYDQYSDQVFRMALKLGMNQKEAMEVTQDVFIVLWDRRDSLHNVKSLEAYIVAISKNITFKKIKKKAYDFANNVYFNSIQYKSVQVETDLEREEIKLISEATINQLSAQQKEIFQLYTQESLSHKDIAAKLNLSTRTIENQIYRAKKKIKSFLNIKLLLIIGLILSFF